ncbi:MAG: FtsX-like permease family protein, partial [Gemmatimonadales bacterium]
MRDWETWVRRQLDLPAMTDGRDQRAVGELAAHLVEVWVQARARGATEAEADALVEAKLGDRQEAVQELVRAERHHAAAEATRRLERAEDGMREKGRGWSSLADLLGEFRLTARTLAKRPLFTSVVVFVLALGIGSTTAIFTLLDTVILSPLPFRDAGRLVALGHTSSSSGGANVGQCAAWHFTYEDENRVFQDLGMYSPGGTVTITGDGEPEAVPVLSATSGVFSALGISALLGRVVTPADEDPDAPAVVLLSHGYWRSRFGEDPTIVGKALQVDGGTREIVGVLPPSLRALGQDPALIIPLRFRRANLFVGNVGFNAVASLKDGVTRQQAMADMARMLPLAFEKFPGGPVIEAARQANYVPNVRPLRDALVGNVANLLWVVMAGVALVLLIACANVANLFLIRADGKDKEMAVRAAMGASRGRIAWEHLKESLLLGALGGLTGLGLAFGGLRALVALAPARLPRFEEVSLDSTVLLFAAAVSLGAALF